MKVRKYLIEWFTLSSRERTGVLVLLVLIMVALTVTLWLRYSPVRSETYDYSSYSKELELFRKALRPALEEPDDASTEHETGLRPLFRFDPNTATKDEMISLGMEERIAARILSYREKGGRFREKEDLLKIYGFDKILFASLSPYIIIAKKEVPVPKVQEPTDEFMHEHPIEINSSDTSVLQELRGIGPVLASRIIKYRGILGGYFSVDQLKEVYGISDSLFQSIKNNMTVDTSLLKKISVNEASELQLSRHPYIGRYQAKAIVAYRNYNGTVSSAEELLKNKVIPPEHMDKIKAYLLFP